MSGEDVTFYQSGKRGEWRAVEARGCERAVWGGCTFSQSGKRGERRALSAVALNAEG